MAELVGVWAASHTPVMLNFPQAIPDADRELIFGAFRSLGDELRRAGPQTVIVVSDDHVHNFFLNNFPAFCIGAAAAYPTPVEHWLKADKRTLRGDGDFGYDPLFLFTEPGFEQTGRGFAELPPHEKSSVSHRGRALRTLIAALPRELRAP